MRAKNIVQMLLLVAVVLTPASDVEAEVAVKRFAFRGIAHYDRAVVDTEKQAAVGALPARIAFAGGKLYQLEVMLIRIAEIERTDPAGRLVPGRQSLRPR